MRAFDLLSKAEQDIRTASHPRYHFEMVLLRWMHLRKLVPLTDLLDQVGGSPASPRPASGPARPDAPRPATASGVAAATRSPLTSPARSAPSTPVRSSTSPAATSVASPARPGAGAAATRLIQDCPERR